MVEIIKKGTPPAEQEYTATCRNCESVLRFKRGEAKFTGDQRDGDFLTITCPVCGTYVYHHPVGRG